MGVLEEILENQKVLLKQNAEIMKRLSTEDVKEMDYIDIKQLQERWGCAYFTINKAMKNGLKYRKFGRKTMFSIEEVKRYEADMPD